MAQTKEGAKKQVASLLAKDPDYFVKLGKQGGKAKVSKGFGKMSKDRLKEVSAKGGLKRKANK